MVWTDYYSLMLLMLFLAVSTYTDIKYGKIKNQVLLITLILAVPILLLGVVSGTQKIDVFCINVVVAAVISLLFYLWGGWAAGDCKLVVLVSILFPQALYWQLPSVLLKQVSLISMYVAVTYGYILIDTVVNAILFPDILKLTLHKTMTKQRLISFIKNWLALSAVFSLLTLLNERVFHLAGSWAFLLSLSLSIVILSYIPKLSALWAFAAIFNVMYWIFIGKSVLNLLLTALVLFALYFAGMTTQVFNYRIIKSSMLKAGMILSSLSVIDLQTASGTKLLSHKSDESIHSRLLQEEVEMVKQVNIDFLRIVRKLPFVLFVLLAIIVYLILGVHYAN